MGGTGSRRQDARYASGSRRWVVLVLDESGKLKTEKLGPDDSAVAEVDAASMAAPAEPVGNDARVTSPIDGV